MPGKIGKGGLIKRVNASINDYEKKKRRDEDLSSDEEDARNSIIPGKPGLSNLYKGATIESEVSGKNKTQHSTCLAINYTLTYPNCRKSASTKLVPKVRLKEAFGDHAHHHIRFYSELLGIFVVAVDTSAMSAMLSSRLHLGFRFA